MTAEDRLKGLGDFIRTQRRLADLSIRQLSNLAKVSNPYLSQIERGIYKPSAEVLKAIAGALHIQAETLFARAGLLEEVQERGGPSDVERAIRMDPRLENEQKSALIRVYRSFLSQTPEPASERDDTPEEEPAVEPRTRAKEAT